MPKQGDNGSHYQHGKTLSLIVVAEGVETQEEESFLKEKSVMKCRDFTSADR